MWRLLAYCAIAVAILLVVTTWFWWRDVCLTRAEYHFNRYNAKLEDTRETDDITKVTALAKAAEYHWTRFLVHQKRLSVLTLGVLGRERIDNHEVRVRYGIEPDRADLPPTV